MTCGMLCVMRRERRGVLHLDKYSRPKKQTGSVGKRREREKEKKKEGKKKENQQFSDIRAEELQQRTDLRFKR